jgi:hypothetical protein
MAAMRSNKDESYFPIYQATLDLRSEQSLSAIRPSSARSFSAAGLDGAHFCCLACVSAIRVMARSLIGSPSFALHTTTLILAHHSFPLQRNINEPHHHKHHQNKRKQDVL